MSKNKREDDQIFQLEREIRELKASNRTLVKQLQKVNKGHNKLRGSDLEDSNTEEPEPDKYITSPRNLCPECKEGLVNPISIVGRSFIKCNKCAYRTKAIKDNG